MANQSSHSNEMDQILNKQRLKRGVPLGKSPKQLDQSMYHKSVRKEEEIVGMMRYIYEIDHQGNRSLIRRIPIKAATSKAITNEQTSETQHTSVVFQASFIKDGRLDPPLTLSLPMPGSNVLRLRGAGKHQRQWNDEVIFVKTLTGKTITVDISSNVTIQNLAAKCEDKLGIPSRQQRLFFNGVKLEFQRRLSDYGLMPESTIQGIFKFHLFLPVFCPG